MEEKEPKEDEPFDKEDYLRSIKRNTDPDTQQPVTLLTRKQFLAMIAKNAKEEF